MIDTDAETEPESEGLQEPSEADTDQGSANAAQTAPVQRPVRAGVGAAWDAVCLVHQDTVAELKRFVRRRPSHSSSAGKRRRQEGY